MNKTDEIIVLKIKREGQMKNNFFLLFQMQTQSSGSDSRPFPHLDTVHLPLTIRYIDMVKFIYLLYNKDKTVINR